LLIFKDINPDSFEWAYNAVYALTSTIYSSYVYLLNRLYQVSKFMRTEVLDHLIVSSHSYFSFKDAGLMDQFFLSRKYLPSFELEKRFQQKEEIARKEVEKHRATIEKQGIQIGEERGMAKGSKERAIAKSMLKEGIRYQSYYEGYRPPQGHH
jgi:hypothetical protein